MDVCARTKGFRNENLLSERVGYFSSYSNATWENAQKNSGNVNWLKYLLVSQFRLRPKLQRTWIFEKNDARVACCCLFVFKWKGQCHGYPNGQAKNELSGNWMRCLIIDLCNGRESRWCTFSWNKGRGFSESFAVRSELENYQDGIKLKHGIFHKDSQCNNHWIVFVKLKV